MKVSNNWWKEAFGKNIFPLEIFGKSFAAVTPTQVEFLLRKTKLKKGSTVLDICCGTGRHSIELSKKGMNVTGLDYSIPYLKIARRNAKNRSIRWTA